MKNNYFICSWDKSVNVKSPLVLRFLITTFMGNSPGFNPANIKIQNKFGSRTRFFAYRGN